MFVGYELFVTLAKVQFLVFFVVTSNYLMYWLFCFKLAI